MPNCERPSRGWTPEGYSRRMSEQEFRVVVSSGDLRGDSSEGVVFPHRWTSGGVVVESDFTGAHLLHLSVAGCVLNDVHREAERLAVPIEGVRVTAWGDFDREQWQSTGVTYSIEVVSSAEMDAIHALLVEVESVAEIPMALRSGATVVRV